MAAVKGHSNIMSSVKGDSEIMNDRGRSKVSKNYAMYIFFLTLPLLSIIYVNMAVQL